MEYDKKVVEDKDEDNYDDEDDLSYMRDVKDDD